MGAMTIWAAFSARVIVPTSVVAIALRPHWARSPSGC
jgi:hypothetical protein